MLKMVPSMRLEEEAQKKLEGLLHNVDNRDFVWMDEILEEAIKMFSSSSSSSGEPLLMPKTPSQKNRQKKKRFSSAKHDQFSQKRLSKRGGNQPSSSKQICQRDSDITKADTENISPCCHVTRSQTVRSARPSDGALKNPTIDLAKGRIPLVEISANERHSAELQMKKTPPQKEKVALSITLLSDESSTKKSQALSKASLIVISDTPEAQVTKEGRGASKLKIANVSTVKTTENEKPSTPEKTVCIQQQENSQPSETEAMQYLSESPRTPRAPKANRQSVRRSLMGRPSLNCKVSLVERCSLSVKRERMVQKSIAKTLSKRQAARRSSAACRLISSQATVHSVDEETNESRPELDPTSDSQGVNEKLRMSLRGHKASMTATVQAQESQQGDCKVGSSKKSEEMQKPSKNVGRKTSYKRALGDTEDEQHTEDKQSPPRKKVPSPPCLASKVVRPFKTFLHTVHKNQMLMTTPGSVSRNSTIKSFLKQNTPLRTTPQEKERQRFENLRKKEEAEQHRRQKLEEEKKRRLEEMKRKREERLRKVLKARERVEQMEEEKKKRLEQKLAHHEEKNEKVREEKMAEDKVKKKVAAKKLEEIEARRRQEDEARKQKALQLDEEEQRHRELMQKKKEEEEQEKARKIAEQRRAELEREKNLAAEKELQKKKEQERLQAQREYEQQEKEKAARLQKEVLAAAKEKERLRKEVEEKERKLQEQQKQEDQQQKAEVKPANAELNVTVDIENSPACNSYQMTPQGPKKPKIELNDYGMDLSSEDSTDDESQPRKPIPAWATGNQLSQAITHQYYNPPNVKALFGVVMSPKLEEIFYKSKPRYFKRTSSAVWNSPPFPGGKSVTSAFKRW